MSKDRSYKSLKVLSLSFLVLLGIGFGVSATTPDVSFGQNGIEINTGGLDMGGGDITDGATTIWDASAGNIATSVIDYSAATATDVGLGNVENENALAQDGSESMNGNLNLNSNYIDSLDQIRFEESNFGHRIQAGAYKNGGGDDMEIQSEGAVILSSDVDSAYNECYLAENASWNCDGTKNWIHDLGNGKEAVYTSQESPEVRAVYEGQVSKESMEDNIEKVSLPEHFSITVSNEKPMLRAQATPHELANVAVTERTDDYLVIESDSPTKVDFRVTGIRDGYEDKQVVRPKEE